LVTAQVGGSGNPLDGVTSSVKVLSVFCDNYNGNHDPLSFTHEFQRTNCRSNISIVLLNNAHCTAETRNLYPSPKIVYSAKKYIENPENIYTQKVRTSLITKIKH
ncbi:hypothetical protein L9F63_001142, partial [Diploptera punctata]